MELYPAEVSGVLLLTFQMGFCPQGTSNTSNKKISLIKVICIFKVITQLGKLEYTNVLTIFNTNSVLSHVFVQYYY